MEMALIMLSLNRTLIIIINRYNNMASDIVKIYNGAMDDGDDEY